MTTTNPNVSQMSSITGAPPTLEWVAAAQLNVDPLYQRETAGCRSQRLIASMAENWDWRLCMPLVVSRRPDGVLMVIDGQHRLSGALAHGGITHLPCVISSFAGGAAAEADAFVQLNTRRQRLTQYDIFRAALASGDADAHTVMDLITGAGLTLAKNDVTDRWKPREIYCAPFLQRQLSAFGPTHIASALHCLANAYPDTVVTSSGTILKTLLFFYRDETPRIPDFDNDRLIQAISLVDHNLWQSEARTIALHNPAYSRTESWVEAFHAVYVGALDDD